MKQEETPRFGSENVLGRHAQDPQLLGLIDQSAVSKALDDPRSYIVEVEGVATPIIVPTEYAEEANQSYFDGSNAYFFDWAALNGAEASNLEAFFSTLPQGAKLLLEVREGEDAPKRLLQDVSKSTNRHLTLDQNVFDVEDGSMAAVVHFYSQKRSVPEEEGHFDTVKEAYAHLQETGEWDVYADSGVEYVNGADIEPELVDELWDVYDKTFDKLVENHPSAQKQPRAYFEQQLLLPESHVTFVRKDGRISSALFALDDLSVCPWLNSQFYEDLNPGHKTAFVSGVSTPLDMAGLGFSELTMGGMGLITQHVPDISAVATQCTNRSAKYVPDLSHKFTKETTQFNFHKVGAYEYPVFVVS